LKLQWKDNIPSHALKIHAMPERVREREKNLHYNKTFAISKYLD
jgi:hypothetical protein